MCSVSQSINAATPMTTAKHNIDFYTMILEGNLYIINYLSDLWLCSDRILLCSSVPGELWVYIIPYGNNPLIQYQCLEIDLFLWFKFDLHFPNWAVL